MMRAIGKLFFATEDTEIKEIRAFCEHRTR